MVKNAIVVGIDRYPDPGERLNGCVNDANDISKCLSLEQYGFDVATFVDEQATRGAVLEALGEVAYTDGDATSDFLLFYFAGHGEAIGDQGYLVTHDATFYDPGIALAHLGQLVESAAQRFHHVLVVLDACHSGGAITWVGSRPLQPRDVDREVVAVNESRCILAACRPEELADESLGQGVFTAALLNGLMGDAVNFNGDVTVLGLHEFVCNTIKSNQTPVLKGDIAGTVKVGTGFVPRRGAPIPTDRLSATLGKAQSLIDRYDHLARRELNDRGYAQSQGHRTCAKELGPILNWFEDTGINLPDLRRQAQWTKLVVQLRQHQGYLASLEEETVTEYGKVKKHLGHGGFGHVWSIERDGVTERAFKVFHGNELDDEVKAQRFKNGHANMMKLDHPRIVKVHELTAAPLGFLMDYVDGLNLREAYLDRNSASHCVRMMIEICETVQHAHGAGVRHRDIKPENIIIGYDEFGAQAPYLTDFDLAYHETNRTVTTAAVGGVINYAAPEQLYRPNAAAARAATVDVYSIGQLVFFIVTGEDPAPDASRRNTDLLRRRLNEWVDGRAASLILELYVDCSQRDPASRTQSVLEIAQVLLQAESCILATSGTDTVSESGFCERFGHQQAGVGRFHSTGRTVSFSSLSEQINVISRIKGYGTAGDNSLLIELELSVANGMSIPGLTTGANGRHTMNARIDKTLRKFPSASRHSGTSGQFTTYVNVNNVESSTQGLAHLGEILSATIASIESW